MTRDEWLWLLGREWPLYGHRGESDAAERWLDFGLLNTGVLIEEVMRRMGDGFCGEYEDESRAKRVEEREDRKTGKDKLDAENEWSDAWCGEGGK